MTREAARARGQIGRLIRSVVNAKSVALAADLWADAQNNVCYGGIIAHVTTEDWTHIVIPIFAGAFTEDAVG